METKPYVVRPSNFDASRPWCVVTNIRTFNVVISRHATKRGAQSAASRRNRGHALLAAHRATVER